MVEYQKVEVGSRERNPGTVPYQKVHIVNDVWVLLTGDEMTGALTINVAADDHIILQRDSIQDKIQQLTPGSFPEGHLVFNVDHSGNITTVGTVDGVDVSAIPGTYVAKAGDTMTGNLTMDAAYIFLGYANGIYANDAYFGCASGGKFTVWNSTPAIIFQIDGSGNITTVGNVDGVDVSSFKTTYDTHAANTSAHHIQIANLSQLTIDADKSWAGYGIVNMAHLNVGGIAPNTDNTFRIGYVTKRWTEVWTFLVRTNALQAISGNLNLLAATADHIYLGSAALHPDIVICGHIMPLASDTYDLGAAANKINRAYFGGRVNFYSDTAGDIYNWSDNLTDCGKDGHRWANLWAVATHFGELGFSDITCPVCKHKFKKNDALVLMVQSATKKEIMTVPAHLHCFTKKGGA